MHQQLEDSTIPLRVVATDVLTGEPACLSIGDTVSAVLASTAIPGVFPAVERDGMVLCDGAISTNAGIAQAVAHGADEVYLLPAGYACALTHAPASALSAALHALALLIQRQLQLEVAYLARRVDLHVLPSLCPVSVAPLDFRRAAELIGRGYRATSSWLAKGSDRRPHPERFLAVHGHQQDHDGPICPTSGADEPPPRVA